MAYLVSLTPVGLGSAGGAIHSSRQERSCQLARPSRVPRLVFALAAPQAACCVVASRRLRRRHLHHKAQAQGSRSVRSRGSSTAGSLAAAAKVTPTPSNPSVTVASFATAASPSLVPQFKLDVSQFTSDEVRGRHVGECGGPPEVEILSTGATSGVLAARGTIRVRHNALRIFERLCDLEENSRIFDANLASVNFRKLVEEDKEANTRLFEVSKTGRWTLLGFPISFESTVLALEDWRRYEIRFRLKKRGAMKHMSGFWRIVPVGQDESIVLFYNEAIPSIPVPSFFRSFASRIITEMAGSLLNAFRRASDRWHTEEWDVQKAPKPPAASDASSTSP
eukprot:TRINITY_DN44792_c0_g1_i1.p1 TRINITY_DN44792_c0_g1~~TRINITY_DN44792_c0_g1_i1.p1  ORF type:complete len:345 (-),score=55.76 TRINITY_DN44792_c0_g1_i1:214-1224(-)